MTNRKIRISILDGFRAIAIISVMLFHYYSRWTQPNNKFSLYPYGKLYDYFDLGQLGVQFFFIISGFVIYFTLEKTENIVSFWKKRIIRLLPSLLLASLFTYLFFIVFDRNNVFPSSHLLKNFIPSVTFINPIIFNNVLNTSLAYIDGAYWSLWPEIQFYFLASCIYYCNKKYFVGNFMIVSIGLILINYLMLNIQGSNKLNIEVPKTILIWYNTYIYNGFNLIKYLPFFCIGTAIYKLYKNDKEGIRNSLFFKICISIVILYTIYSGYRTSVRLVYMLMISLFFIFIYFPSKLSLFENSKITNIGESSYFLYLIHQNIGVFIIYSLGQYILPNSFIMPIILIIGLSYLSILFTNKIDKPINNLLKKKIMKR